MEIDFSVNIFTSKLCNKKIDKPTSDNERSDIWIFGYGSLCWFPGFNYEKCITGYIKNFDRKFYQGNFTHRGTKNKPGRVVTLISNENSITYGCAYKVHWNALDYLNDRECNLGGYEKQYTKFFPRHDGEAFEVIFYNATSENLQWLGEDSMSVIANQIVDSNGQSGSNVEYLMRLVMFMRDEFPDIVDEHLFKLEELVTNILIERKIDLSTLMGNNNFDYIIRNSRIENIPSFEFTSRVPKKKLLCLNI